MRLDRTTLLSFVTTSLLSTPVACTGVAPDSTAAGAVAGLNRRPSNPSCLAGPAADVPALLSQLGCFDPTDISKPSPGLVPYDVNAPLWSDDAEKQRWLAIPDATFIHIDAEGQFALPQGSVLLKTFYRTGVRLETRVWMNHPDAGWLGYAYRWADDGSDASLAAAAGEVISNGDPAGPWTIPGRAQCSQCHPPGQSQALGLHVAQLDRDFVYPSTGRRANQLQTLAAIGMFEPGAPLAETHAKLVDYRDVSQPLAARARSYLHANCSSCHASAAGYCAGDLRISTSDAQMGLCNVTPGAVDPSWGWLPGTSLLAPGDPERSALWLRVSAPAGTALAMPPLGRTHVHEKGVELIAAWIGAMPACKD